MVVSDHVWQHLRLCKWICCRVVEKLVAAGSQEGKPAPTAGRLTKKKLVADS